jgi:uncharacterized protein YjbI with pentapeptide repeats
MSVRHAESADIGHNSRNFGAAFGASVGAAGAEEAIRFRARYTPQGQRVQTEIDFDAKSERDARRRLRVMLAAPSLPPDLELIALSSVEAEKAASRARRARFLLRVMSDHFRWLAGLGGERAELPGLDLTDVVLEDRDLTQANLRGSDLTGACLKRSRFSGANLSGAVLRGADLRGADLSGADLSNADLRGAVLIGARLDNVDVWRANFAGAIITPEMLHQALNCKRQIDRLAQPVTG